MKEEKNIDRLFQEKFKDFNAKPSAKVWANIEKELKEDKERMPFIIPLWYKIGGIAAALVLVFWFSQSLLTTDTTNTIVDQDGLENTKVKTQVEDKDTFNNNSKLSKILTRHLSLKHLQPMKLFLQLGKKHLKKLNQIRTLINLQLL